MVVLDASVFAAACLHEPQSEISQQFIESCVSADTTMIAPSIFAYEVLNVLSRKGRTYAYANDAIKQLLSAGSMYIENLSEATTKRAFEMSQTGHEKSGFIRFYDAAYHALAIEHDCEFITLDKRHYQKAQHFGHIRLLAE